MFILNYHLLKKGDIILDRDGSRQSSIIREISKSEYSHARLYVGGTVIESEGLGVQSVNPQRLLYRNRDDVIVMRSYASEEQIGNACIYARSQCTKEFSLKDIKKRSSKIVDEPNRQFCTRLVAQAYEYAGYSIVENAALCSPRDIEQSTKLYRVNDMVHLADEAEIEMANSEGLMKMDGEYNEQASISGNFMSKIRLASNDEKCDIQDETQLVNYLIKHQSCDTSFVNVLISHPYFTMWQEYEKSFST